MIIESGAVYTACLIVEFVLLLSGSSSVVIIVDVLSQIMVSIASSYSLGLQFGAKRE